MTILELLQSEETPCHVQGQKTVLVRMSEDGSFEVFGVKKDSPAIQLYTGYHEEDAVAAFIAGEKL